MSSAAVQDSSIKSLWRVSFPLMVSFFCLMAMVFVDHIFLVQYSIDALNAVINAGTLAWGCQFGCMTLAAMCEVIVAQQNGAKRFNEIGRPVWQMIWLSIFTIPFYLIMGSRIAEFFYGNDPSTRLELEYFRWLMYMSPFSVLLSALSAFYIGQGKTRIIQGIALLGNAINICLDPLLIFGYKKIIPEMGVKGAAIATGIGVITQALILLAMFLHKKNRAFFGTSSWKFHPSSFWQGLKLGFPLGFFVTVELIGWAVFYQLMEKTSDRHSYVVSVCHSIMLIFFFFGLGLEKGAATLSGNLIGAGRGHHIRNVFRSGLYLSTLFLIVTVLFFVIYPDPLISLYERTQGAGEMAVTQMFATEIRIALGTTVLYLFFENIRMLLNGILASAGDTLFLTFTGSISVWLFMLLPTYLLVVIPKADISIAFIISNFYSGASAFIIFLRYQSGKWKGKQLIEPQTYTLPVLQPSRSLDIETLPTNCCFVSTSVTNSLEA